MADKAVQIGRVISQRVQGAQQAAHTGAHHQINGDIVFFQILEHANGSRTLGTAAGEHQAHGGARLANPGHPLADFPYGPLVARIQAEGRILVFLGKGGKRKQQHEQGQDFFHGSFLFSACFPAKRPQAA